MSRVRHFSTLAIGLIGGVLGALLVTSLPAATGATGDAIKVGEISKGNATTILRSAADPTLRVVSTAGGEALDLRVGQGNRPLLVDSNKRVPRLNADRLDGLNANQMLRVAFDSTYNAADEDGFAVSATITAPTDGYLVMAGSVELDGLALDSIKCRLAVTTGSTTSYHGTRSVDVHNPGVPHTADGLDVCATNAVSTVPRGTYGIALDIDGLDTAGLNGANVWAIFVPFDGSGGTPDFPKP